MKFYMIFSTIDNIERAREIGKKIVKEKLARCVNIIPFLESIYIWDGELNEDKEVLMIYKVSEDCVDSAIERIKELHPYEVPEVVAISLDKGNKEYLEWLKKGCGGER